MSGKQNSSKSESRESRVAAWRAGGKSIREWSSEHAISASAFTYWKLKFSLGELNKNAFVEILQNESTGIEIRFKGLEIHIGKEFDEKTLSRCLKVIRGSSC